MSKDLVSEKLNLRASQDETTRANGELRNSQIEITRLKHQQAMAVAAGAPQGGTPSIDDHLCGNGACEECQRKAQEIKFQVNERNQQHIAAIIVRVSQPLNARITTLEGQLQAARDTIAVQLAGASGPSPDKDIEIERLRALVAERDEELRELRTQLEAAQAEVNEYWELNTSNEARVEELEGEVEQLTSDLSQALEAEGEPASQPPKETASRPSARTRVGTPPPRAARPQLAPSRPQASAPDTSVDELADALRTSSQDYPGMRYGEHRLTLRRTDREPGLVTETVTAGGVELWEAENQPLSEH